MVRKEYLDKFKKLYKDKYNISLSDEETTELATHFLNLMEVLIKPKNARTANNTLTNNGIIIERSEYANR